MEDGWLKVRKWTTWYQNVKNVTIYALVIEAWRVSVWGLYYREVFCFQVKENPLMGRIEKYVSKTLNSSWEKLSLCGKEFGIQECSVSKGTLFCVKFCLRSFFSFYINNSHSTGPHCAQPFIAVAKRKHIWNVIGTALKGLVLVLKGSPCTCVFTALSLSKVRPPLLDKCKAFSALSTSCCPVQFHWLGPHPPLPEQW